jgi:hypothetical protein
MDSNKSEQAAPQEPNEMQLRTRQAMKAYLNSPLESRHLAAKAAWEAFPNPPKPFIQQEPLSPQVQE